MDCLIHADVRTDTRAVPHGHTSRVRGTSHEGNANPTALMIVIVIIAIILSGCVTATTPAPVSVAQGAAVVVTNYVGRIASDAAGVRPSSLRWLGDADDGEDGDDDTSHAASSEVAIYSVEPSSSRISDDGPTSAAPLMPSPAAPGVNSSEQQRPTTSASVNAQLLPVVSALNEFENSWTGVRYKWGGNGRSGIDCSALVGRAFLQLFDMQLPRTTRGQVGVGSSVKRTRLRPGDLVFFRLARGRRHVGVYLGDDRFLHASRSRGVAVSSLGGRYWSRHYWTARRVLESPKHVVTRS